MKVIAEMTGVSNHAIGERNLCLSAVVEIEGKLQLIVPNQTRKKWVYIDYANGEFSRIKEEADSIDFSQPIYDQLDMLTFENENNCRMDL